MPTEYTLEIKRFENVAGFGRIQEHDSRSKQYPFKATTDPSTLKSKRHHSNIPILNQGQIGSCTGNAATKCLSMDMFWNEGVRVLSKTGAVKDEKYALGVYSAATKIDEYTGNDYPPTDQGSSGIAVAKVLQSRGLISGYLHSFDIVSTLNALAEQPVIIGIPWYEPMSYPSADGHVTPTGNAYSGHEICLDEIDVERKRVWFSNSWGAGWGVKGRAWMTWDELDYTLQQGGDCTIFVPTNRPAPVPVPIPPKPKAVEPDMFVRVAREWIKGRKFGKKNKQMKQAVQHHLTWLKKHK